jgi:hypothetical protein
MSAKPTPGPWQFYRETTVDRGDGYGIKAPAPHHWVIPPLNLNPADVKMMAAAPDMLDALKELASCGAEAWGNDRPCVAWAMDVIAKAEGK